MRRRKKTKYIHEGGYVAMVDVTLMDDEDGWSPYLSVADACKLDDVRDALRRGDLRVAAQYGQIYELRLVANGLTNKKGNKNALSQSQGRRSHRSAKSIGEKTGCLRG